MCGTENESDAFSVPTPNYVAETHHDSIESEWYEDYCSNCDHCINVELYNGFYGGTLEVDLDNEEVLDIDVEYPEEDDVWYDKELFDATHADVIKVMEKIDSLDEDMKFYLYKLLYANLITSMEAYLSDTLIKYVTENDGYLRKFTETYRPFRNQTFTTDDIFNRMDHLKDIVKGELRELMYHNLPKIKQIFMDSMGVDIGVIKDLYKAVLIRHDIVHRNGKDKDGKEHVITKENVEQLCALVNDFIYNIECQLPPTATSVEEIGSPFDVTL
jgi:hypothetical protein